MEFPEAQEIVAKYWEQRFVLYDHTGDKYAGIIESERLREAISVLCNYERTIPIIKP